LGESRGGHRADVSEQARGSLADEQAALRRVATLVARGTPPEELFAAVVEQVAQLLPVEFAAMGRYDPDGMFTTVAAWSTGAPAFPVGGRWLPEGKNATTLVLETGRPARIDDFVDASGPVGDTAREAGYRSAVGTPIIVEGHLWGVMTAASSAEEALPTGTEGRLASFTELVATAIANAESRAGQAWLAEEEAALRRVATLVARAVPPEDVFAAVTEEVGRLLDTGLSGMGRYDSDDTVTVVATWAAADEHGGAHPLVPGPWPLEGGHLASTVAKTGRPVRIDSYDGVFGRIATFVRDELGIRASVASPILVDGRLCGAFCSSTQSKPSRSRRIPNRVSRASQSSWPRPSPMLRRGQKWSRWADGRERTSILFEAAGASQIAPTQRFNLPVWEEFCTDSAELGPLTKSFRMDETPLKPARSGTRGHLKKPATCGARRSRLL
jgi:GAF domain-containing protein